ncbi:MAG: addiction module toxin, HicA family [Chloroflexi bacterium]|nr:addiction module toxin, HicA family [Chloroflexota bacterium]
MRNSGLNHFEGLGQNPRLMPQLSILNARQVISALQKAGFEVVRQKGSHIRLGHTNLTS